MAKVTYTAFVSTVRGKIRGDVGSAWKGRNYIRTLNPSPRQPRTEKQQNTRGYMASLAGEWYALDDTYKELWNKYGSLMPQPITGLNAYIMLNANLWKYLGTAAKISYPPATPSVPGAIVGLSCASVDSTHNQCSWTAPSETCILAIIDFSPMAGYDEGNHPRWSFAVSASASALIATHTHAYPTGTIINYQARSMDESGRITPNSVIKQVTTPA